MEPNVQDPNAVPPEAATAAPGPLGVGRYESVEQLTEDLVSKGPKPETYQELMEMVGPENEDVIKDALGDFFQGMAMAAPTIYRILINKKLANPIDANLVERIKMSNGTNNVEAGKNAPVKVAGLFLPPTDSGLNTVSGKFEKTAGGSVGGAGAGYPAYLMTGPGENRMCPKIRKPVSTFICRYHCLDGLNVDDAEPICGEAIWRQAVMDKFSREYRDKDGNWVGGYLNKRFETHRDDGGHPMLLKPGQRSAPIHEDAWSTEKRMQEMRRSEGKDRGYSETPGDPKNLYNFDPYDLKKGPKNPQLFEKNKDSISKLAITVEDSMFKGAGRDPRFKDHPEAQPSIEEVENNEPTKEDEAALNELREKEKQEKQPKKKASFNLREQRKADTSWLLEKQATAMDGKADGFGNPLMPMGEQSVQSNMACPKCGWSMGKNPAIKLCPKCNIPLTTRTKADDQQASNSLGTPADMPTPRLGSTDCEVKIANDVFCASKNGVRAYGDSYEEAVSKLAAQLDPLDKDLSKLDPGTVDQQSSDILGNMQETEGDAQNPTAGDVQPDVPVTPPAPPVAEEPAPAPVMEDQDPNAVGQAPVEVEGGQSEFADQQSQQPQQPTSQPGAETFVSSEPWDPKADEMGEEEPPRDHGHVAGDELDKHLPKKDAPFAAEDTRQADVSLGHVR
jgi:rubrerythrin